jgi:hypothetical protein
MSASFAILIQIKYKINKYTTNIKFQENLSSWSQMFLWTNTQQDASSWSSKLLTCLTSSVYLPTEHTGITKHAVSSNFQAPVDRKLTNRHHRKMILKRTLRKYKGWCQQNLSCSEKGKVVSKDLGYHISKLKNEEVLTA